MSCPESIWLASSCGNPLLCWAFLSVLICCLTISTASCTPSLVPVIQTLFMCPDSWRMSIFVWVSLSMPRTVEPPFPMTRGTRCFGHEMVSSGYSTDASASGAGPGLGGFEGLDIMVFTISTASCTPSLVPVIQTLQGSRSWRMSIFVWVSLSMPRTVEPPFPMTRATAFFGQSTVSDTPLWGKAVVCNTPAPK